MSILNRTIVLCAVRALPVSSPLLTPRRSCAAGYYKTGEGTRSEGSRLHEGEVYDITQSHEAGTRQTPRAKPLSTQTWKGSSIANAATRRSEAHHDALRERSR